MKEVADGEAAKYALFAAIKCAITWLLRQILLITATP